MDKKKSKPNGTDVPDEKGTMAINGVCIPTRM